MNRFAFLLILLGTISPVAVAALPRGEDLVKAKMLADVSSAAPGEPFHVGVLLKIEPHWHVYWKNPGESGVATKIDLTLPEGFKAGPWQFPVPSLLEDAGGIVMNGYADEVMLIAQVTPPANLKGSDRVRISGKASWLVCAKTCIPGQAQLSLELPVAEKAAPAHTELFSTWMKRLPSESGLPVEQTPGSIRVYWTDPPEKVEWFFDPPQDVNISNVKTETTDRVSRVSFKVEPAGKKPLPDEIEVVVGYTTRDGGRAGQLIRHPLIKSVGVNK